MIRERPSRIALLASLAICGVPAGAGTPTYKDDIAPLLDRACLGCHRPGGLGRVELDTYEKAKRYAPEIRTNVGTRSMPPWRAVPGHGQFRNQRVLTVAEIELIVNWTDSGTPEGSPASPRTGAQAPRTDRAKWILGAPDYAVRSSLPFKVPATGDAECRCFSHSGAAIAGRAVRAVDVRPGNAQVVAYVRVFADPTGNSAKLDKADPAPGYDCFADAMGTLDRVSLGEWSAGIDPDSLPAGVGRLVPPGSDIVVEIRYNRLGYQTSDQSEIGFYLQQEPVRQFVHTKAIVNRGFQIPAGAWDFQVRAEWVTTSAIRIISVSPHLNLLGMEARVTATPPGDAARSLVWVRDWNRHWQMAYVLEEPLLLPSGAIIAVSALYNNSSDNEQQFASPPRPVKWGWGDHDERLIVFVEYVDATEPTANRF